MGQATTRGPLCPDITQFCQLAWNSAKHEYHNHGSSVPMIPFADVVGYYFLARALVAAVLQATGLLKHMAQADLIEQDRQGYQEKTSNTTKRLSSWRAAGNKGCRL